MNTNTIRSRQQNGIQTAPLLVLERTFVLWKYRHTNSTLVCKTFVDGNALRSFVDSFRDYFYYSRLNVMSVFTKHQTQLQDFLHTLCQNKFEFNLDGWGIAWESRIYPWSQAELLVSWFIVSQMLGIKMKAQESFREAKQFQERKETKAIFRFGSVIFYCLHGSCKPIYTFHRLLISIYEKFIKVNLLPSLRLSILNVEIALGRRSKKFLMWRQSKSLQ